jgi:predicted HTH transcriptional regulator
VNAKIKKYLTDGEGEHLDFKQTVSSAAKIAKTMVSFANTRGGVLLIGVRDNRSIAGIQSDEEFYMLELAGSFFCKPEIVPQITEHRVEGKIILEAYIPEGVSKPYYAKDEEGKWWVYVRTADKSLLASKTTVDFLHRKYGDEPTVLEMGTLEKEILAYISSREKTTLSEICKRFNMGKRRIGRIVVNLMALDVVRSHTIEKTEFFTGVDMNTD